MTRYDIAMMRGYNSVEEYDEAEKRKHQIFTESLKKQKTYVEKEPVKIRPVKHGKWIKQEGFWNKNTVKCSLCGNYLDMNGVNGGRSDANYCPNCGADLRGEENEV